MKAENQNGNFSKFDLLSIPEVEYLLRKDYSGGNNPPLLTSEILYLCQILAQRCQREMAVEDSWEKFKSNYLNNIRDE